MARKVLVIEDEDLIREVIVLNLSRAGFSTYEAANGEDGIDRFNSLQPDVVLLDINLPGIDGFDVCTRIREKSPNTGIMMLTARSQEADRIGGLKSGADDYVTKPFSTAELIARVEALARRVAVSKIAGSYGVLPEKDLLSGAFRLSRYNRTLTKNGVEIDITQVEGLILAFLMLNSGKELTRREIFDEVWPEGDVDSDMKIVDVNIRRLRMKIEDNPSSPNYIQTVWGTGYRWNGGITVETDVNS